MTARERTTRLSVALALGLALGVGAATAAATAAADVTHAAWAGHWKLNKDESDSLSQMLEAMEVPWYLKAISLAFTPELEIKPDGEGLIVDSEMPFGSPRRNRFSGNGSERSGEDVLERPFRETSRWSPDGFLLVHRDTDLPSGAVARVDSTWKLSDDTLHNDIQVQVGQDAPFTVRRVFDREGPADASREAKAEG